LLTALAALALHAMAGTAVAAGDNPSIGAPHFHLPVDCVIGKTCMIQFHVDLAPGPEIQDYACGRLTYDDHKGTDFRLPDYVAMRAGVDVLAAADGVVRAIRDGEPDISVDVRGRDALAGKWAGNSVVIVHGGGWESQYSHLMKGSVAVKPGDVVTEGQRLGRIGQSGNSDFPHLDFSVRLDGKVIDPFLGPAPNQSCKGERAPLWDAETSAMLPYRPSGVLLVGFSAAPPDKAKVRDGAERALSFGPEAPALVFYTDVFGLQAGDVELFSVTGPGGAAVVTHRAVQAADAHQRFNFAGRKRPEGGWPPGVYHGRYQLLRQIDGKSEVVAEASLDTTINAR